jgi:hypothetical protein
MEFIKVDLPCYECDFNACGWSGESGDDYFYAIAVPDGRDKTDDGLEVLLYMDDSCFEDENGVVMAVKARLEWVERGAFKGWRGKPDPTTWCRGRLSGRA